MMADVHSFLWHMPKWAGFVLLLMVWMLFRSLLLGRQRRAMERMRMQMNPQRPAVAKAATGQVRCPRCSAGAPAVASFCPHCGLAFNSLPPPLPLAQMAQRPSSGRLVMLIWILLGVIGFAAYLFWRFGDEASPAEPQPPRVRIHEYHR